MSILSVSSRSVAQFSSPSALSTPAPRAARSAAASIPTPTPHTGMTALVFPPSAAVGFVLAAASPFVLVPAAIGVIGSAIALGFVGGPVALGFLVAFSIVALLALIAMIAGWILLHPPAPANTYASARQDQPSLTGDGVEHERRHARDVANVTTQGALAAPN